MQSTAGSASGVLYCGISLLQTAVVHETPFGSAPLSSTHNAIHTIAHNELHRNPVPRPGKCDVGRT